MTETPPAGAIVVLGATGDLGAEVSRRLRARGTPLMLGARDPERLAALAAELGADSAVLDARRPADIEACVERAVEICGRVDGVVNCVGSLLLKPAHLTTDPEWDETLAVNLTSSFAAVRAGARAMMRTGGSIVLVSTAAARIGLANHEAIAAAKAGVQGLALAAAASYAHRNIRVNTVAPGMVRSRLTEKITEREAALKASAALHALGRIGEPREVASAILWLLDPENSWVTGQVIGIDGGLGTLRSRG